jgi:tetratricopeptide (TPR) repeat protein
LYWENLEGLRKAAAIYSLRDENEALNRIQELGVTHILLFSWDSFGQRYVRLQRGLGKDDEARDGFIPALLEGTRPQPAWLTPLYYPLPKEYKLGDDQWVRIYAVAPGQSRAEWFHGVAIYQLDAGKEDLAERSLREALTLEPGKVNSRIALLLLLATQQRPAELAAEVQSALKNIGANAHKLIQQAAVDLAKSNQTSAADALQKALSDNEKF